MNVTVELIDAANIRDVEPLPDLAFGLRSNPSAFIDGSHTHGYLARDRFGAVTAMGGWTEADMGAKIFSIATSPEHRHRGLGGLMKLQLAEQSGDEID
jgi:ribosomal protein S18 acetylase RimI-like enzyme